MTNVPLLIVTHNIQSDEAIDKFNEMKAGWAAQYREWKETYINFDAT